MTGAALAGREIEKSETTGVTRSTLSFFDAVNVRLADTLASSFITDFGFRSIKIALTRDTKPAAISVITVLKSDF